MFLASDSQKITIDAFYSQKTKHHCIIPAKIWLLINNACWKLTKLHHAHRKLTFDLSWLQKINNVNKLTENWTWPQHSDRKMTIHAENFFPDIFLFDLHDILDTLLKVFQNAAKHWNIKKYTVSWDAAVKLQTPRNLCKAWMQIYFTILTVIETF